MWIFPFEGDAGIAQYGKGDRLSLFQLLLPRCQRRINGIDWNPEFIVHAANGTQNGKLVVGAVSKHDDVDVTILVNRAARKRAEYARIFDFLERLQCLT